MRRLILYILTILCIVSCKTVKEVEVPITNTKTEYINKVVYDSIYNHDSIYLYIKGDTVFKYKEKIQTRYILKTDTVFKNDTIQVPVKVATIKEVNKVSWYQSTLMSIGAICLLTGVLLLLIKYKKIL